MKNLKYFVCFIAVLAGGCTDSFLEKKPTSEFLAETMFDSSDKALLTVTGCYGAMADFYVNNSFIDREGLTDNASSYGGDLWGPINSDYLYASDYWRLLFRWVARCNFALDGISSMHEGLFTSGVKTRSMGEVLALKALAYHELTFRFGDVPYYDRLYSSRNTINVSRTPRSEVLNKILSDLDEAISYLPSVLTYRGTPNEGRISKETAIAIKARVQLFNGRYGEAATEAKRIISASPAPFELTANYAMNFVKAGNNNKEGVLYIGRISGFIPSLGIKFNDRIAPKSSPLAVNGLGYNMVIQELIDQYQLKDGSMPPVGEMINSAELADMRDPRLKATVLYHGCPPIGTVPFDGIEPGKQTKTGYAMRKYLNPIDQGVVPNDMGQNFNVIRYADVLLMAAEGLIESNGNLNEAASFINQVRQRPGVNMPPIQVTDRAGMRAALRHERRVEMALEGFREYDLIRWRIFGDVLLKKFQNTDGVNGTNKNVPWPSLQFLGTFTGWNDNYYLWPIPGSEFELNPNLGANNQGY